MAGVGAKKAKKTKAENANPASLQDKKAIQVDAIIDAAVAEIDEFGLEAFRIRNLANRLDVFPASVYWYMSSKELILSEVVKRVLADVVPADRNAFWRDRLRELFIRFRDAVRAHPNAAPLTGGTLVANATMDLGFVEAILSIVKEAGLRGPLLVAGYNIIIAAIVGFVTEEFAVVPRSKPGELQTQVSSRLAAVTPQTFPVLAEHRDILANRAFIVRWENGTTAPLNETFSYLIDTIIIGLEGLVVMQNARTPPPQA